MSSGRGRCARTAWACCALRCATSQRSSPPASSSPARTSARSWTRPTLPGAALPTSSCLLHGIALSTYSCQLYHMSSTHDGKRTDKTEGGKARSNDRSVQMSLQEPTAFLPDHGGAGRAASGGRSPGSAAGDCFPVCSWPGCALRLCAVDALVCSCSKANMGHAAPQCMVAGLKSFLTQGVHHSLMPAFVLCFHKDVRATVQLTQLSLSQQQMQLSCTCSTVGVHAHELGLTLVACQPSQHK